MSTKYLGPCFDIHGGGSDLIFPHHENEIAQSEAATDCKPTSHYWMHLGMVNVAERNDDGELVEEKMSKSLGNFWTTRDVLDRFDAEAIRYFLLTTHYRKPITYSLENLEEATQRVEYLYATLMRIEQTLEHAGYNYETQAPDGELVEGTAAEVVTGFLAKFENALANDFNTSKALAALGELAKVGNELTESSGPPSDDIAYTTYLVANHMRKAGRVLGILERPAEEALRAIREQKLKDVELTVEEIEEKIAARKEARATEDWEAADEIRDELVGHGIVLMDKDWGTIWRVK
jgi:cysteinyl-tRNA synthetase